MTTHDAWKTHNPADAEIGNTHEDDTSQCDCCARMVPRDEISRCWTTDGIETFACDDCRGWNK
jgi:hypothetical protein